MRARRVAELRPVPRLSVVVRIGWAYLRVLVAPWFLQWLFGVSLEGVKSATASLALLAVALDEK